MADMLGLAEVAKRLNLEVTAVRRLIAREGDALGIKTHRGKGSKLFLSKDDAERLIASYEARRGAVQTSAEETSTFDRYGFFYIIQLVPEALPNRVKIGFADSVERRLTEHHTAAPTARVLKAWPCKRSWDYAAMDSITKEGCKLVLNEDFEGDIAGFVERGDKFFAVMPNPDSEKELSEYSPLFGSDDSTATDDSCSI